MYLRYKLTWVSFINGRLFKDLLFEFFFRINGNFKTAISYLASRCHSLHYLFQSTYQQICEHMYACTCVCTSVQANT